MTTVPRLIVLDLDGTSARYEPRFELDPAVREALAAVRAQRPEVRWALNSDRFEGEMIRLAEYLDPDERPDAIMSCQHLLYRRDHHNTYQPDVRWNQQQRTLHRGLWDRIFPKFNAWQQHIRNTYPVHEVFVCERYFAFRVPPHRLPCLRGHVEGLMQPWPDAKVSGNHEWVFVVHDQFSKGRLLTEFAAQAGYVRDEILAIGDGYNDLPMLDRSVAKYAGCPADAAEEVRNAIKSRNGIIAKAPGTAGTVEIIRQIYAAILQAGTKGSG